MVSFFFGVIAFSEFSLEPKARILAFKAFLPLGHTCLWCILAFSALTILRPCQQTGKEIETLNGIYHEKMRAEIKWKNCKWNP